MWWDPLVALGAQLVGDWLTDDPEEPWPAQRPRPTFAPPVRERVDFGSFRPARAPTSALDPTAMTMALANLRRRGRTSYASRWAGPAA